MLRTLVVILALLVTAGCSQPLPKNQLDYVGDWGADSTSLTIRSDGTVSYRHKENSMSTSIDAPIVSLNEQKLVVGVWFITTTFELGKPTLQDDGVWTMTVDGVKLVKQ